MSAGLLNSIIAVITLAGLAWLLYRPKLQESGTYEATVVPYDCHLGHARALPARDSSPASRSPTTSTTTSR